MLQRCRHHGVGPPDLPGVVVLLCEVQTRIRENEAQDDLGLERKETNKQTQYSCAERNDDYHEESGERGIHSVCRLNFNACSTAGITEKEIHSLRQEKDRSIRQWRPLHDADGRLAPADRRD
ncbi:hypothetical protein C0Q70_13150 [Pomacea canaliculata]|uniref:Uncharacterized protein n=1 Tax=Pomacea canaliculata TaxID=400727 RepID=A0A2T7NWG0_POMCA|nr:hypothetical protein C0Q70_13150 [Pomacea canaliculata]